MSKAICFPQEKAARAGRIPKQLNENSKRERREVTLPLFSVSLYVFLFIPPSCQFLGVCTYFATYNY